MQIDNIPNITLLLFYEYLTFQNFKQQNNTS